MGLQSTTMKSAEEVVALIHANRQMCAAQGIDVNEERPTDTIVSVDLTDEQSELLGQQLTECQRIDPTITRAEHWATIFEHLIDHYRPLQ